jgi:hypothetical protein
MIEEVKKLKVEFLGFQQLPFTLSVGKGNFVPLAKLHRKNDKKELCVPYTICNMDFQVRLKQVSKTKMATYHVFIGVHCEDELFSEALFDDPKYLGNVPTLPNLFKNKISSIIGPGEITCSCKLTPEVFTSKEAAEEMFSAHFLDRCPNTIERFHMLNGNVITPKAHAALRSLLREDIMELLSEYQ